MSNSPPMSNKRSPMKYWFPDRKAVAMFFWRCAGPFIAKKGSLSMNGRRASCQVATLWQRLVLKFGKERDLTQLLLVNALRPSQTINESLAHIYI